MPDFSLLRRRATARRPQGMGGGVIRLTIVGDVLLYREGLAHALGPEEGIVVVGTAATLAAAAELVDAEVPDIVLVDLGMPDALDAVREFASRPGVRVVVLAVNDTRPERARERLYVGLSRARDQLVVCGDPDYIRKVGGESLWRTLQPSG